MQATPKVLDFFIIDLLFFGMNYSTVFLFYVLNTETEDHHRNGLLRMIQGTLKKNTKVLNEGNASVSLKERFDNGTYQELEEGLAKAALDSRESAMTEKCSICESNSDLPDNCGEQSAEDSSNDGVEDKSLAIVPVQKEEAASSSISVLKKELPESKPGWPLLRRSILPDKKESERSLVRQISVVQWALRLPSRKYLYITFFFLILIIIN